MIPVLLRTLPFIYPGTGTGTCTHLRAYIRIICTLVRLCSAIYFPYLFRTYCILVLSNMIPGTRCLVPVPGMQDTGSGHYVCMQPRKPTCSRSQPKYAESTNAIIFCVSPSPQRVEFVYRYLEFTSGTSYLLGTFV